MNTLVKILSWVALKCNQNKYMNALKNAFQSYMPATIVGAIGMFWTNVLINDHAGLGAIFPPIMILKVFNPIFKAMNYATISCISIGIILLVANEIAQANGDEGYYSSVLAFVCWIIATPHTLYASDISTQYYTSTGRLVHVPLEGNITIPHHIGLQLKDFMTQGISMDYTSSSGLFTAIIIGIVATELYYFFRKNEIFLIKLPDQVSTNQVLSFMNIIPTLLTTFIIGAISQICIISTGGSLNTLIYKMIQSPLQLMAGDNLIAVLFLHVIIMLFWIVGFHGQNLMSPIVEVIYRPLLYVNMAAFDAGLRGREIPYIFNTSMFQMFGYIGGSGCTLGLVLCILLFSKRHDNHIVANVSLVPGIMNINETVIFGMPLVLNPILDIPFILAPLASLTVGYFLIRIGFCPHIVAEVPWVMPPVIYGFLVTGGSVFGAISQILCFLITMVIYAPFLAIYERNQKKQEYIY